MSEPPHTVLVVDDNRVSRDQLATMVEALGYRAVTADGGLEGLRVVREAQPSLVLLDLVMPDFDGYKVAAAIKAQPRFVPVILLTGASDLESKRRGQAAGADDFLTKPVHQVELQIRIAAMIRIRALTEALDAANRRLAELADTDALTGIANRRRFDQLIATEFERCQRYQRPLSVLTLDIDHFKKVNDTHGHAIGDDVLKVVAGVVAKSLRTSDHMARTGGEEFVVLAPESNPSGALALGERLRRRVEGLSVATPSGSLQVTISVGVVAWDGVGVIDSPGLLKASDDALYQAKEKGRNRVVLALVRGEAPK
ncbi:MAG: diguanylate cyclase [Myxococcales bacterium]|nr:diguanylate cyclase [Myxococcales bacterium]